MEEQPRQSDLVHIDHFLRPYMQRWLAPIELNLGQLAFEGLGQTPEPVKVIYRRPPKAYIPAPLPGQLKIDIDKPLA